MDRRPIADPRPHPNSVVRWRGKAGLTIRDLASVAGINEKTLRWIEIGRIPLQIPIAGRLSVALGCAVEDLIEPCQSPRNPQMRNRRRLRNLNRGRGAARWAGKLPIPAAAHPLVRELFEAMNDKKMLISDVAQISGVSKKAISDWRYKRAPGVVNLEAVLNALDLRLAITEDDNAAG